MKSTNRFLFYMFLFICFVNLLSCGHMRTKHHSSSVVQYLYPDQKAFIETPTIPRLSLPIRVGIAFVPEKDGKNKTLTETDKMDLMKEVSIHFKKHKFVKSIELIPSAYLRSQGSFANLEQIHTMYGVDVIALISYDQTQFTDEGLLSITYKSPICDG